MGILVVIVAGIAAALYFLRGKMEGGMENPPYRNPEESTWRRMFTTTPEEQKQKIETRQHKADIREEARTQKAEIRSETVGGLEDFIFGTTAEVEEAKDRREHEQKMETREQKAALKEDKKANRDRRRKWWGGKVVGVAQKGRGSVVSAWETKKQQRAAKKQQKKEDGARKKREKAAQLRRRGDVKRAKKTHKLWKSYGQKTEATEKGAAIRKARRKTQQQKKLKAKQARLRAK